ncbi:hypothetical protein EDB19DRAFT_1967463, partial [Suillus lakei]
RVSDQHPNLCNPHLLSRLHDLWGRKETEVKIDQFSAANPLEAMSLSGGRGAVPYHVPFAAHPVGLAIMISGGFEFLGHLHGLSSDNLVEAEIVLADGQIVVVSQNEYSVHGAGPAFGAVTRYKARAYSVPVAFGGNLIYRVKHFHDCVKGALRKLYANVLLTAGPAGQDSLVVIQMCYIGPKDGEQCLLNEVDEKSPINKTVLPRFSEEKPETNGSYDLSL